MEKSFSRQEASKKNSAALNYSTMPPVRFGSSAGQKLPDSLREQMEEKFNFNFKDVQIHHSPYPSRFNTPAMAFGSSIHFAPGKFNPETSVGKELLGHELAHVVQQKQHRVTPEFRLARTQMNMNPLLEAEADKAGKNIANDLPSGITANPNSPATIQSPVVQGFGLLGGLALSAGLLAIGGGLYYRYRRNKRNNSQADTISERYDYDSDNLSEEEGLDDAPSKMYLRRAKGERLLSIPKFNPREAMLRLARSIRRFRKGTSTAEDESPFAADFPTGPVEMTPTKKRKDGGAYRLVDSIKGKGFQRKGGAKNYPTLGRDLDEIQATEGLTTDQMNEELNDGLLSRPRRRLVSSTTRSKQSEAQGVFLTDMARGSAGPGLVQSMLTSASSFYNRFKRGGEYRPADLGKNGGGSQFIQAKTRAEKEKRK